MGIQISALGYGKIAGGALFFAGLGVYTAYSKVSDWYHYAEVPATITGSSTGCAQLPGHPDYPGKIVYKPCGSLADLSPVQLTAGHYVRSPRIQFAYISPVDGNRHEGEFAGSEPSQFDRPEDQMLPGKVGRVLASKDVASEYRVEPFSFRTSG